MMGSPLTEQSVEADWGVNLGTLLDLLSDPLQMIGLRASLGSPINHQTSWVTDCSGCSGPPACGRHPLARQLGRRIRRRV